jgi:hypothetical protein
VLKLFYAVGTCALASHIALEEADAEYDATRAAQDDSLLSVASVRFRGQTTLTSPDFSIRADWRYISLNQGAHLIARRRRVDFGDQSVRIDGSVSSGA